MYRLTDSFPYLLAQAGVRMGDLFAEELKAIGMSLPMYRVLAALWELDGQRLSELSEMISVETSTLSRLIGEMKKQDLVSRQRKVGDERSVRLSLTANGRERIKSLIPRAQHYESLAVRGFSAAEVTHLKAVFRAILKNLATEQPAIEPVAKSPPAKAPARSGSTSRA
jgi:MarR family transcriptional regulator, organic hydroperoxide resistance regulator